MGIGNPFKSIERKIRRGIDGLGKDIRNGINKAGNEVKGGITRAGREVEGGLKRVGNEVEDGVRKVASEAEDGLREAGREIEKTFEERLPDLVEDAIEEITSKAAQDALKTALNTALDTIEMLSPSRYSLTFGVELALVAQVEFGVTVGFPNPTAKLTEIREWAKHPPSGRGQIVACIKDFAPDVIEVSFGVCGNGFSAEWDGDDKYDRLDAFLEKRGV